MWDVVTGHWTSEKAKDKDGRWIIKKDSCERPVKGLAPGVVAFHVEPHQLRHTYITELCASGMDIKKIQYLAGHTTAQMTLDIYAHVTQNRPEQLSPAIISAFGAGKSAGNRVETSARNKK